MGREAITRREVYQCASRHGRRGTPVIHRGLLRSVFAAAAVLTVTAGIGLSAGTGHAAVRPAQSSASDFTLYTEPDAGFSWLYDQINDAETSIDMTMYELSDTTAEEDLVAAEERGVETTPRMTT
jgi:hypothetical protein